MDTLRPVVNKLALPAVGCGFLPFVFVLLHVMLPVIITAAVVVGLTLPGSYARKKLGAVSPVLCLGIDGVLLVVGVLGIYPWFPLMLLAVQPILYVLLSLAMIGACWGIGWVIGVLTMGIGLIITIPMAVVLTPVAIAFFAIAYAPVSAITLPFWFLTWYTLEPVFYLVI